MAADWPFLKTYDEGHLRKIALPLGGIGTGTISLGGRGDLRDWEIMNRPAKGFTPKRCFFALFCRLADDSAISRALEGPIDPADYNLGEKGCEMRNHGLPRFRRCRFSGAYPLGQVELADPDVPLDVCLQAFNPFIPGDVTRSSIPVAIFRFNLINSTAGEIHAALCGSVMNIVGYDRDSRKGVELINTFREDPPVRGIYMTSSGMDPRDEDFGSLALSTPTGGDVSYRTSWSAETEPWGLGDFWDDFSLDGRLKTG